MDPEEQLSDEKTQQWLEDFDKAPLRVAREATATWLRRVGEVTGTLDGLDRTQLRLRAMDARAKFYSSSAHMHREALLALDAAAERVDFARHLLQESDDAWGLLNDAVGLLNEAGKRLRPKQPDATEGD